VYVTDAFLAKTYVPESKIKTYHTSLVSKIDSSSMENTNPLACLLGEHRRKYKLGFWKR